MAVYVDEPIHPYRGMMMCHMLADTTEELMAMAQQLNLKPSWIQHPGTPREHFDIATSKRTLALKLGARAATREEIVAVIRGKRAVLLATVTQRNASL